MKAAIERTRERGLGEIKRIESDIEQVEKGIRELGRDSAADG